jgi:hypothetical protein
MAMSYYDDADDRVYDYLYDANDIDDLYDEDDMYDEDDDEAFVAEYDAYYHDVADEISDE